MKALGALHIQLVEWLVQAAYPLWSTRGIDAGDGGFIEALDRNAVPLAHPRRARVPPRQIYTFAQALGFGWQGDAGAVDAMPSKAVSEQRMAQVIEGTGGDG